MNQHGLCWIAILIASVLSTLEKKNPIVISLEMRKLRPVKYVQLNDFENDLIKLKSEFQKHRSNIGSRDLAVLPLERENSEFVGEISIGSSREPLRVVFDTGSPYLWVPGRYNGDDHYDCKSIYEPKNSQTAISYGTRFEFQYKDQSGGMAFIWSDRVSIGGLEVQNQTFGVAYNLKGALTNCDFDGLMGMPPTTDQIFPMRKHNIFKPTFLTNLLNNGIISEDVFGFFFARESQGSQLYLGGYDHAKAPKHKLKFYPLVKKDCWSWIIKLDVVKVNDQSLGPVMANIDTGASHIFIPKKDADDFYAAVNGAYISNERTDVSKYIFPCSQVPAVNFTFGGADYPILKSDLIVEDFPTNNGKSCTGSIVGKEDDAIWELGVSFLLNVYTVFDVANQQIGFTSLTSWIDARNLQTFRFKI